MKVFLFSKKIKVIKYQTRFYSFVFPDFFPQSNSILRSVPFVTSDNIYFLLLVITVLKCKLYKIIFSTNNWKQFVKKYLHYHPKLFSRIWLLPTKEI